MTPTDVKAKFAPETEVVRLGRDPFRFDGFVNPPVVRGSTVLYPSYADLAAHRSRYSYGRRGNPTTEALEMALKALEGSDGVVLTPSGLSACSIALLSALSAGDHLLMVDTAYYPTRRFCDTVLKKMGVETSYYDPLIGADITNLLRDNTRAIFLEAPGSQSFEMQDIPAITAVARARGITTLIDNTWATPLFFRPHDFGVDISIQAGTKYIGGHADLNLGTISAVGPSWKRVHNLHGDMGICISPDDAALGSRGLRTLAVRLERHQDSALKVARWMQSLPQVSRVLHPALESDPGHAIWKRDFKGSSGLFSAILKPVSDQALAAFFDALVHFGMGYSWGGYESLIIAFDCTSYRTATRWHAEGPAIRLHIGLENTTDLMADLEQAFAKMSVA
ncbi:MAG: cystathionine beta-lyase [Rhizobiales bacterium 35-66-30]|jgi:cystathionine beta-lyase|nr:MAG: cystathionine beta-lyase [Azorhizobium sp. 12-66-6]OYY72529.1 MAG: cystathionine beta-lyase [Rhizobiales bacterium 35-66-30]